MSEKLLLSDCGEFDRVENKLSSAECIELLVFSFERCLSSITGDWDSGEVPVDPRRAQDSALAIKSLNIPRDILFAVISAVLETVSYS